MRKNIVAGNWKMNKTLQEGVALATELKELLNGWTNFTLSILAQKLQEE